MYYTQSLWYSKTLGYLTKDGVKLQLQYVPTLQAASALNKMSVHAFRIVCRTQF